jgi:hypothetical protein
VGNFYYACQVFEELEQAKQEHGQLNHIIMNAAVMACVTCKDIDRALTLYDEMAKPGGCGVDNVTYGTLLKVRNLNQLQR